MNRAIVTTSWDDGHALDLRLAALLAEYGIAATFYIAPENREIEPQCRLTEKQIRELSDGFEIGAHTMTHPILTRTTDARARQEIMQSKSHLEAIVGRPVTSFCYPRGMYLPRHVSMVRAAGYSYARTVRRLSLYAGPPLQSPTSVHASDHWGGVWQLLLLVRFNPVTFMHLYARWDRQAIYLFDCARERGGVFHLWGHSWEIARHDDWLRLETVLRAIADREDVDYRCNGELV